MLLSPQKQTFEQILRKRGYYEILEKTIGAFRTLNLINDYILNKVDDLNRQEKFTLTRSGKLAYEFGAREFEDYNQVYARCRILWQLFDYVLAKHEQDIMDEYGPRVGPTLWENRDNMEELLELGNKWIIQSEGNNYNVDLEIGVVRDLLEPGR